MLMEQNLLHRCFDLAVEGLYLLADSFGTTYEAVNIYLFVIIQPLLTILLIVGIFFFHKKNNNLQIKIKKLLSNKTNTNK